MLPLSIPTQFKNTRLTRFCMHRLILYSSVATDYCNQDSRIRFTSKIYENNNIVISCFVILITSLVGISEKNFGYVYRKSGQCLRWQCISKNNQMNKLCVFEELFIEITSPITYCFTSGIVWNLCLSFDFTH